MSPEHGPELVCDQRDFGLLGVNLINKRRQNIGRQARSGSGACLQNQSDTEVMARPKFRIDGGAVANVVEFRGWRSLRALTQP